MTEAEAPTDARRAKAHKTTIAPAPDGETTVEQAPAPKRASWSPRSLFRGGADRLAEPQAPLAGTSVLRTILTSMLSLLCLLTVGGAILLLLLWQQERDTGVLSTQLDRTWELFGLLRTAERWLAFAVVPVAMAWIFFAVLNVRRASGRRPNPVIAMLSLPAGLGGAWYVGRELIDTSDDVATTAAAFVLQSVFILVPLVILLRVAVAAEARHAPMRAAAFLGIALMGIIQFLGALSTVDENSGSGEWGLLGAYMIIAALTQVLGVLAANEGARAIEEGTEHRYQLRSRFGESVLAQAGEL